MKKISLMSILFLGMTVFSGMIAWGQDSAVPRRMGGSQLASPAVGGRASYSDLYALVEFQSTDSANNPARGGRGAAVQRPAPSVATAENPEPSRTGTSSVAPKPQIGAVLCVPVKEEGEVVQTVHPLHHMNAGNVLKTLESLFERPVGKNASLNFALVKLASDTQSNTLLLNGPMQAVNAVEKLIDQMDRMPALIRIEVRAYDVDPAKVKKTADAEAKEKTPKDAGGKQLFTVEEPESDSLVATAVLTTLDNQPATVQAGRNQPTITGVQTTQMGQSNSIAYKDVGMNIAVQPRVTNDGFVVMVFRCAESRVGSEEEGTPVSVSGGKTIRSSGVDTFTLDTTIQVELGKPLVVGGMHRDAKSGKERLVYVVADLVKQGEEKKAESPLGK